MRLVNPARIARKRLPVLTLTLVIVALTLATVTTAGSAAPRGIVVGGTVKFADRQCFRTKRETIKPVKRVPVHISRKGAEPTIAYTNAQGQFEAVVEGGTGPVTAELELTGRWARIHPATPRGEIDTTSGPVRIPIPNMRAMPGNYVVYRDPGEVGALNVWDTLLRGGRFAGASSIVPIAGVKVMIPWNPSLSSRVHGLDTLWEATSRVLEIGGGKMVRQEFEDSAILHEYGHYVVDENAPTDPNAGDDHSGWIAYPHQPGLAWSEGFPTAFSMLALNNDVVFRDCQIAGDYSSAPARDAELPLQQPHLAAYNEVRAAGVGLDMVEYLGGGSEGLKKFFRKLAAHKVKGHTPYTMRDVRDAMIAVERQDPNRHREIDNIFRSQGMQWGHETFLSLDDTGEQGAQARQQLQIWVEGPRGFRCEITDDTLNPSHPVEGSIIPLVRQDHRAAGGLTWWDDECWIDGADGALPADDPDNHVPANTSINGFVEFNFPYLSDNSHAYGEYRIMVNYLCENEIHGWPEDVHERTCAPTRNLDIAVQQGMGLLSTATVTLTANQPTQVVKFNGHGWCTIASAAVAPRGTWKGKTACTI